MNKNDMDCIRNLAEIYSEYACGKVMDARREKWRKHNRMQERTFPFHIQDNGKFMQDLMPPLQCEGKEFKELEQRLLYSITSYEKINDDRIIPSRFLVNWQTDITPYCEELRFVNSDDGHGGSLGFESNKPIQDIDSDFYKLKKRKITLNRKLTGQHAELAHKAFDGLLPVAIGRASSYYSDGMANKAVHLMGMEELFMQMAVNTEAVHRLFTFLAEDNLELGRWEEEQGLLTLNNDGNQGYCSGSSQFSDEIIMPAGGEEAIRSSDRYGYLEAQEATGLSPDMFGEFFMPYLLKLAEKFKLMKFGCCEPVHGLMPYLENLQGLRKVSVTPWCNLEVLASTCRKDIIWSRKPTPLKLCGSSFDLADFRTHLKTTLDIGKNHFIEFVFRDTCLLDGSMAQRVDNACKIVRDLTGHPEGGK
ncbi:MAG: hypothetical protein WCP55_11185 [Lentisphaerota bacterium]